MLIFVIQSNQMLKEQLEKIVDALKLLPEIKLAYFFGSKARGDGGQLSDYDFAFYVGEKTKKSCLKSSFFAGQNQPIAWH